MINRFARKASLISAPALRIMATAATALLASALSGCVSTDLIGSLPATNYVAHPPPGDLFTPMAGYSNRRLDEKRYLISVRASHVTPEKRLQQIALARAAQLSLELKNKYFKLGSNRLNLKCVGQRVGAAPANILRGDPTYELEIELAGNQPKTGLVDAEKTFKEVRPLLEGQPSSKDKVSAYQTYVARCRSKS